MRWELHTFPMLTCGSHTCLTQGRCHRVPQEPWLGHSRRDSRAGDRRSRGPVLRGEAELSEEGGYGGGVC